MIKLGDLPIEVFQEYVYPYLSEKDLQTLRLLTYSPWINPDAFQPL